MTEAKGRGQPGLGDVLLLASGPEPSAEQEQDFESSEAAAGGPGQPWGTGSHRRFWNRSLTCCLSCSCSRNSWTVGPPTCSTRCPSCSL